MAKPRSKGVTILAGLLILMAMVQLLGAIFMLHYMIFVKPHTTSFALKLYFLIYPLLLICFLFAGWLALALKEVGRKLLLWGSGSYLAWYSLGFLLNEQLIMSTKTTHFINIILPLFYLYFFTLPEIKEQFAREAV